MDGGDDVGVRGEAAVVEKRRSRQAASSAKDVKEGFFALLPHLRPRMGNRNKKNTEFK